jgi:extradiol dioxygenase family protein
MDGKKLVCGKIYADDSDSETVELHLEKNVVNNDLNYKDKEDVLIRINAVSTLKNGDKIEVTVGDETGEERQLSYYGIEIEAELTKLANEDLKKYKVDGFTGSVKAFGIPFFKHGMKVNLESDLYPDRNGLYYVEETIVDFNDTPNYRRKGQLGDKVTT